MKYFYMIILGATLCLGVGANAQVSLSGKPIMATRENMARNHSEEGINARQNHLPYMVYQTKVAKESSISEQPIEEQPEGRAQLYTRDSGGFWSFFNEVYINFWTDGGSMMVEGEDGYVYLAEPYSGLTTGTWLKCRKEADKLVAELPQPIYTEYYGETGYVLYAQKMSRMIEDADQGIFTYEPTEDQTVTFTINADGTITLDMASDFDETEEFAPEILGLCDEEGRWAGVGDWRQTYTPFDGENETPSKEIATKPWAFTSNGKGFMVKLGLDGDGIWIQGYDEEIPDAWVKGTVNGGKATFATPQFLGYNPQQGVFEYFTAASIEMVWNEDWEDYMAEKRQVGSIIFDYDKEKEMLVQTKQDDEVVLMINNQADEISYDRLQFPEARIRWQPEAFDHTPMDPVLTYYTPYSDESGFATLYFDLPYVTEEGFILDREKMYFKFYVDLEEWTFEPDEYEGLEESMTLVPYNFDNGYSLGLMYGITHNVNIYADGFENLGVRSFYIDGDDEYHSYLVYYTPEGEGAVDSVENDEVIRTVYHSLDGLRVENPQHGIFIRTVQYASGQCKNDKIIIP